MKLIFCGKKWSKQWFCSLEKRSESLKKDFSKKKFFFQLICADIIYKTMYIIFFK